MPPHVQPPPSPPWECKLLLVLLLLLVVLLPLLLPAFALLALLRHLAGVSEGGGRAPTEMLRAVEGASVGCARIELSFPPGVAACRPPPAHNPRQSGDKGTVSPKALGHFISLLVVVIYY